MKIFNIIAFAALLGFTSGCIEDADEDLFAKGKELLVVEARFTNQNELNHFKLSKSVPGSTVKLDNFVTDAKVQIINSKGEVFDFTYVENGHYENKTFSPKEKEIYELKINQGGVDYSSTELMPQLIDYDSVSIGKNKIYEDDRDINIYMPKIEGLVSQYWIEVRVNDSWWKSYDQTYLFTDEWAGETSVLSLSLVALGKDDHLELFVYRLSKNVGDYMWDLSQQVENTFGTIYPPIKNPKNNISPEALGVFMVAPVFEIDTVLTE